MYVTKDHVPKFTASHFIYVLPSIIHEFIEIFKLQSLKWRIERNADNALDYKMHPFFAENYQFDFAGTDNLGQPGE